ncbi:MAG: hypothetical protein IPN53_25200 [Comamonadaceae bacterium]|nr:hypothetical protein [Comamonadaceae bacterium]
MPVNSVEDARAWMQANLDPARRKGSRFDKFTNHTGRPPQTTPHPTPRPTTPAAAIETAAPLLREPIHTRPGDESFDAARTREKIAAANLIEIQEAALRGTYLIKDDFERYLFNAGRMLRDTLTNCARRIGAEVAGLATADECEAVIDREHRAALASFSQQLRTTLKIEIENNPLNVPATAHKSEA